MTKQQITTGNKKNPSIGVRPMMGYLLIDPATAETKTASGIYLPESAQEKPTQGVVVAVGENLFFDGKEFPSPVKVGDTVIYKKWGGDELKVQGKEYKLVKFDDLMAIVED